MKILLQPCKKSFQICVRFIQDKLITVTTPSNQLSLATGTFSDLSRSKSQLLAQNALLRQQLIVLNRQNPKPNLKPIDRFYW